MCTIRVAKRFHAIFCRAFVSARRMLQMSAKFRITTAPQNSLRGLVSERGTRYDAERNTKHAAAAAAAARGPSGVDIQREWRPLPGVSEWVSRV